MSSVITTTWGNQLLNIFFGTEYTLYVALFTAEPGLGGSFANEVAGGAYVRQASTFSTPSSKTSSNDSILSWPNMPECYLTHIGICSAVSSGTLMTYVDIPGSPVHVPNSAEYRLQVGDVAFSF